MKQIIREGSQVCVSLDFSAAGNCGNWTTEGCNMIVDESGRLVTCVCNHLTNFTVLVVSENVSK